MRCSGRLGRARDRGGRSGRRRVDGERDAAGSSVYRTAQTLRRQFGGAHRPVEQAAQGGEIGAPSAAFSLLPGRMRKNLPKEPVEAL